LDAPFLPFDGMNEAGLAVGMAAVPDESGPPDPQKETIDSLLVIRKILDEAATIEEAVVIIQRYNLDWGSGPALHYLIMEESGRSALVEFSEGELVIQKNQGSWQVATNFLVTEARGDHAAQCWRYGLLRDQLDSSEGMIRTQGAIDLLEDVAQQNTQWSVVYQLSAEEVWIAMGRDYSSVHQFPFSLEK
jgi:predicted choloylglycine hydrolase